MTVPTYRFWGKTPPQAGARTPVLEVRDEAEAPEVVNGVAKMRLYDPIDSWGGDWGVSAKEFAKALDSLPDETTEIRLHINSPGGEVYEGLAILNALRSHDARVVAVVDGLAASIASVIASGADEVVMGRNTQLMIHNAWGLCVGASADMRSTAERLDMHNTNIASVYAAKAGTPVDGWLAAMDAESWYSADEAVTAGLADRVEGEKPDNAKAFDTKTLFNHDGRSAAPAPIIPVVEADSRETADAAAARATRLAYKARAAKRSAFAA